MQRSFLIAPGLAILLGGLLQGALSAATSPAPKASSGYNAVPPPLSTETAYVFGWGDLPAQLANPRGGSTEGATVTFAPGQTLPLPGVVAAVDGFNRDRAAILAMAGDFRVGFHQMEPFGLAADYKPTRSYHSWATEKVHVVEDTGRRISLQHTLVMYFKRADGTTSEPMLTKHWRQDWTYEDTDLHLWRSDDTWVRRRVSAAEAAGTWTHSVFNLEDSLRYEAMGRWEHQGNVSRWASERAWRPLPRREYTVRKDYDVIEGIHAVVITPTGWIEERNMWKRATDRFTKVEPPRYVAQEFGIDRYERISAPSLAAATEYWRKSDGYWAIVRRIWAETLARHDRFSLRDEFEEKIIYQHHNEYVKKLEAGQPFDPSDAERHVRRVVAGFLLPLP